MHVESKTNAYGTNATEKNKT